MTEGAALDLIAGGSVTGFNQSMVTLASLPVPEPMTLGILGMGLLGLGMVRYRRA